jgi:mycothiol system anti-sigma-R factor
MSKSTPQDCADWADSLHAFADGELDYLHAQKIEHHLAGCERCSEELAQVRDVKRLVDQNTVRWVAPETFRASVVAAISQEHANTLHLTQARTAMSGGTFFERVWQFMGRWGAAPSLVALGVAAVLAFGPLREDDLQGEVLASHVRSMLANHLVDVQTSDQHTVRPWFNGKVDFSPPVVDLKKQGFPLVGGRVDYLGGRVVAALVYRRDQHVVNLFVWPEADPVTHPVDSSLDGYSFAKWSAGGLTFWAVSDASSGDVKEFRRTFSAATGF